MPKHDDTATRPANREAWPEAVSQVLEHAITVEYTSLSRTGTPIMIPVNPYVEPGTRTVDVSTGLTYPAKAERARRNPKVCLLFADHVGSGLADAPVVLIQGLATVRDADLQANTDRYVRQALAKTPEMMKGLPRIALRRLIFYFARIWIEVTPIEIMWWGSTALDHEPGRWLAPAGTTAAPSDAAPAGKQPPAWLQPPANWQPTARKALGNLDQRDLAWIGASGFPLSVPVAGVEQTAQGFTVRLGDHLPGMPHGRACLTFHVHPVSFTRQENRTFIGEISRAGPDYEFRVERLLADVSLAGGKLANMLAFVRAGRRLRPRLAVEAGRRGQRVPEVRFPR